MVKTSIGLLGFAILGLIAQKPQSGYELRRQFTDTPMKLFSGSPGAVYPALRRLFEQGLLTELTSTDHSRRRKQVFAVTDSGRDALVSWMRSEITREDVEMRMTELHLRFAFTGQILGPPAATSFLECYLPEVRSYAVALRDFAQSAGDAIPITARLSLEHGIAGYECSAQWAERALQDLTKSANGT